MECHEQLNEGKFFGNLNPLLKQQKRGKPIELAHKIFLCLDYGLIFMASGNPSQT